jgi:hypothetical protein
MTIESARRPFAPVLSGLEVPALGRVGRARIAALAPKVALLSAVTPENFVHECQRLAAGLRRGSFERPKFVYPDRDDLDTERAELFSLAEALSRVGHTGLARVAGELLLEAEMVSARETKQFHRLAAKRFRPEPSEDEAAEALAGPLPDDIAPTHLSDDKIDPLSLLSAVRAEVGRLFLPVRVTTSARLAALAAVAGTTIVVAEGRRTTAREARRTALHEVHGHVVPALSRARREREASLPERALLAGEDLALATQVDAEEGRALVLEDDAGFLDEARLRDLGLRHLAARWAHEGAELLDVVRGLEGFGLSVERAVFMAARACRAGGLGRERVYLPAYFRERSRRTAGECGTVAPCER